MWLGAVSLPVVLVRWIYIILGGVTFKSDSQSFARAHLWGSEAELHVCTAS